MSFARALSVVLCFLLCSFLACIAPATAQNRIAPSRIAVFGNYWFGSPLTFDRTAPSLLDLETSISGTSKDHSYGIAGELGFSIDNNWSLLVQPGYRIGSGEFVSSAVGTVQSVTVTTKYQALDLGLLASYRLTSWLSTLGGTSLTFYPVSSVSQTRTINDTTRTVATDGDLLGKPLHLSIPLGARFTLFQSGDLSVGLDLLAAMNITEAVAGNVPQSFKGNGGIWIAWNNTEPPVIAIKDSIFIPVKPRLSTMTRFMVNDQDADSITVTTIDTVVTTSTVIPQYLYFESGNNTLDASTDLLQLPTMFAELGKRLNDDPKAQLTIELRRTSAEPVSIFQDRATMLKQIIGADRVAVTQGKLTSDHAYALLRSTDPLILAPLRTREVRRDQRVDHLSIDRSTIAEAGVHEWSVVVLNEGDTLVRYGSDDASKNIEDASFSLPTSASRLLLHSFVIDRAGQRSDSYDTLHVRSASNLSRQVTIDEYLFSGQESPSGQAWSFDRSLMDLLIKTVTPATNITITSLLGEGQARLPEVTKAILEGCLARGIAPGKIEVLPSLAGEFTYSPSIKQTLNRALLIRSYR